MTSELCGLLAFGQDTQDYQAMFALSEQELSSELLECCIGPTSFNAEQHAQNHTVTSVSPLFNMPESELIKMVTNTLESELKLLAARAEEDDWAPLININLQQLQAKRSKAMDTFLKDISKGYGNRYQDKPIAHLPYADHQFDIALCSHWLFYLSNDFNLEQHIAAIKSLCRVAKECRIYPLIDHQGAPSEHVGPIMQTLQAEGYDCEIKAVNYQLQAGENAILRVWARECPIP